MSEREIAWTIFAMAAITIFGFFGLISIVCHMGNVDALEKLKIERGCSVAASAPA